MVIEVLDQTKRKLFQKKQAFDAYAEVLGHAQYDVDGVKLDLDMPTKTGIMPFRSSRNTIGFRIFIHAK